MVVTHLDNPSRHTRFLLIGVALVLLGPAVRAQGNAVRQPNGDFVLVNITTSASAPDMFKDLTIVRMFPSTGMVLDDRNYVVTHLGYWWVTIRSGNPSVQVVDSQGRKRSGRIVGIDQSTTIAVIECEGKPLKKTPLCEGCEIKDVATVVLPPQEDPLVHRLESAPLVSVSTGMAPAAGAWTVQMSRPLTLIGGLLLDSKQRVIGIVSDQEAAPINRMVTIYPLTISQVLLSANKIIKTGGDIVTGYLGVNIDPNYKSGVLITGYAPGSPAHKAGIRPGDVMVKWNGVAISDYRKYVEIVENTPVGTTAKIEVLRDGKPVQIIAVIESRRHPVP